MENVTFKGDFIRQRRKALGLTQAALGAAIGVTHRTIWQLEHGTTGTKIHRIPALAHALGASVQEICELPEYLSINSN